MAVRSDNFTFQEIYDEIFGSIEYSYPSIVEGDVTLTNLFLSDLFHYSTLNTPPPYNSQDFAWYEHIPSVNLSAFIESQTDTTARIYLEWNFQHPVPRSGVIFYQFKDSRQPAILYDDSLIVGVGAAAYGDYLQGHTDWARASEPYDVIVTITSSNNFDVTTTGVTITVPALGVSDTQQSNFTAVADANIVNLTWQLPAVANGNQLIELSESSGAYAFFREVDSLTVATTHVADYSTDYSYRIRSQGAGGNPPSDWVYTSVTTPASSGSTDLVSLVSIADFGAVGDGVTNDRQALLDGVAATVASGKTLWIPAHMDCCIHSEAIITQNNVKILLEGKISANTPDPYANDWRKKGYQWSTDSSTPDYQARYDAYNCAYRVLTWNGTGGTMTGGGMIDGKFDNSQLSTWGAKLSTELMGVYGDYFTGDFEVSNAGGYGIEFCSEGGDINITTWDCGYSGLRLNVMRDLLYMKVSVSGGKVSTHPNSRTSTFTLNGSNYLDKIDLDINLENGSPLFEGVVGSGDGANEVRFKHIVIGTYNVSMNTPYTYESGSESSYHIGKFENCGVVEIGTLIERSDLTDCGGIWTDKTTSVTIGTFDTTLYNFRPAPVTNITSWKFTRSNSRLPEHITYFDVRGNHTINIDEMIIDNNGFADMKATFGIFNLGNRVAPTKITIGSITNIGLKAHNVARYNSTTASGIIDLQTGTFSAENITAPSRLLAP